MSAKVISFPKPAQRQPALTDVPRRESLENRGRLVSALPFEFIYHELFRRPTPTPEDLLREQFLLECD